MTTHHRVTGPRPTIRICWAVGCCVSAVFERNERYFCAEHGARSGPRAIIPADLTEARRLMSAGGGLAEVATSLGVLKGDLDKALWRTCGDPQDGEASQ